MKFLSENKKISWSLLALVILMLGILTGYLSVRDNIHTVIPGKFYRSAQLDAATLEHQIEKRHIRSIINLRGYSGSEDWYQDEIKIARESNIQHFDLKLNAHEIPPPLDLKRLVELLEVAPRPVLIHCQGGADRTGLASAFVIILQGGNLHHAKKQISWFYLAFSPTSVGRLVFPFYEKWLHAQKRMSTRENLLQWAFSPQPYGNFN